MKIYTKTGDKGTTSLVGGERVSKTDARLEAYGTVDELQANVAYLLDSINANPELDCKMKEEKEELLWIIERLMRGSALLATSGEIPAKVPRISDEDISRIEAAMDRIDGNLEPLTKFVLPGGHPLVSLAHIARTVCRRAERDALRAAEEKGGDKNTLVFLNRLSDYLYLLSKRITFALDMEERCW